MGIGDSSLNKSYSPVLVESLSMWAAKKVGCTKNSSFALMENGELFSWGSCLYGVLGIGDANENQYFPIQVIVEES